MTSSGGGSRAGQSRATGSRVLALLVIGALLVSGCASTTRIHSSPAGAEVVMDDQVTLGSTPLELRQMAWLWSTPTLRLTHEGYEAQLVPLDATFDPMNLAVCLCTAGLLFPVLFLGNYPSDVVVELQPLGGGVRAELSEQPVVDFR